MPEQADPAPAEEVKVCGILVSRNKPKKGYVDISGTVYAYADWVEPFLGRHANGDVVDVIYKQHRNGGKTLVSIQKAKDPSKAVPVQAPQEPAYKTGTQIMQEKTEPAPAQQPQNDTCASSPAAVQMWTEIPKLTLGGTLNLENFENLKLEVTGSAADREKLKAFLDETAAMFGRNHEATREKIDAWRRRVLA